MANAKKQSQQSKKLTSKKVVSDNKSEPLIAGFCEVVYRSSFQAAIEAVEKNIIRTLHPCIGQEHKLEFLQGMSRAIDIIKNEFTNQINFSKCTTNCQSPTQN